MLSGLRIMTAVVLTLFGFGFVGFVASVSAYEVPTHARITQNAISSSVLAQDNYLATELGLSLNTSLRAVTGQTLEIAEWIVDGSESEDDFLSGQLARFRNHFYDPTFDRGLTGRDPIFGTPIPAGMRAFQWAVEDTNRSVVSVP